MKLPHASTVHACRLAERPFKSRPRENTHTPQSRQHLQSCIPDRGPLLHRHAAAAVASLSQRRLPLPQALDPCVTAPRPGRTALR